MKERTPEEKHKNVVYQLRHKKKRRLTLKVMEFMGWLNNNWPIGVDISALRMITIRLVGVLHLPYRWTDKDLARAYKGLEKLKRELYVENPDSFTHEYYSLLTYMMDAFENCGGTTEERVRVVLEAMRMIGTEVNGEYGEKKPNIDGVMHLVLATGMSPYPQWVKDDLAKFIVENFDEEERKAFCEKILKSEDVQKKGDSYPETN